MSRRRSRNYPVKAGLASTKVGMLCAPKEPCDRLRTIVFRQAACERPNGLCGFETAAFAVQRMGRLQRRESNMSAFLLRATTQGPTSSSRQARLAAN
jgi:hypothetical protein